MKIKTEWQKRKLNSEKGLKKNKGNREEQKGESIKK